MSTWGMQNNDSTPGTVPVPVPVPFPVPSSNLDTESDIDTVDYNDSILGGVIILISLVISLFILLNLK